MVRTNHGCRVGEEHTVTYKGPVPQPQTVFDGEGNRLHLFWQNSFSIRHTTLYHVPKGEGHRGTHIGALPLAHFVSEPTTSVQDYGSAMTRHATTLREGYRINIQIFIKFLLYSRAPWFL